MAVSALKRGEAVVWIPPRSVGERAFATEARLLLALTGPEGLVVQSSSLDALPPLRAVRLVFDARDVSLLDIVLPPLSGARLRQALPNMLEDRLLQEPQSCLLAPGPALGEGRRPVAVVDRAWFEFVVGAFERRGVRVVQAVPGQLSVAMRLDCDMLLCLGNGIALRTGRYEGLGWQASDDARGRVLALEALLAQRGLQREDAPPPRLVACIVEETWKRPLAEVAERTGLAIELAPLALPDDDGIDLLVGRDGSGLGRRLADMDWRAWRWPVAWLAASALVFLVGLNLHWYQMRAEGQRMRTALERGLLETFPRIPVAVDPLRQMDRELAGLRARAGQSGPSDFVPLLARLAQALGPQAAGALTGAEFRDGRLTARFAPSLVQAASVRQQMEQAGRRAGLRIEFTSPGEPVATVSVL